MAEVYGIVTVVLGLLPLCRDGLGMITDVFDETRVLELAVARLELQRDRFDEWRDIWRNEDGDPDIKFEAYAKSNLPAARRVLHQLALMSQTLFDVHALEDKYGIKPDRWPERESKDLSRFRLKEETLTLETQGIFLERCKVNLTFIKRCKFVFRKKDTSWHSMIDSIRDYNDNLQNYGPKADLQKMLKAEFNVFRVMQLAELKRRADAAAYEVKNSIKGDGTAGRYQDLSLAAQFSTVVRFERPHAAYKFTMRDFRLDPTYALSSGNSTMALLFDYPVRKEHRVVLIEWVEELDRDQERETRIKALMLATPKPEQLLLPKCYGMVDDPERRRYGLVLAPPDHIRSHLPAILPAGAISKKRMPISLLELLETRHPLVDLGIRFRLAKKLVDAVHMMHCVGYIHKNIRSNSILFFPAANIPSRGPPGPASGIPQPLGYTSPVLVGLSNARIDDPVHDPGAHYPPNNRLQIMPAQYPPGTEFVDQHGQLVHLPRITRRPKDINLDYYQHPDKRYDPSLRYNRAHDIYSLGCVLLEIGLWKSIAELVDAEDEDFERVRRGLLDCSMRVDGMCGSIYGNVVRRCLNVSARARTEAEVNELSKFMVDIAATLEDCWA